MLDKVRDFPYDLPKTLSSALALLLTEVIVTPLPSMSYKTCEPLRVLTPTPPGRCSFCVKTRKLGFGTWSVSRCSPSSAVLPLTHSSFRRNPLKSSSSSGPTLIGRLLPREALRTLTWLEFFSLLTVSSFLL